MDDKIKVVIITGTGERSFCAGRDLRYVINIDPIKAERYASFMHNLLNKIEETSETRLQQYQMDIYRANKKIRKLFCNPGMY